MDLVSIITPAYQTQDYILRAIKSVLAQTYEQWEMLIIADDLFDYKYFCQQQSIQDSRLKFLTTGAVASGPSNGRNLGMRAASGNLIALLDSDDYFLPQKLEQMVPKTKEYGMTSCSLALYSEAGDYLRSMGDRVETGPLSCDQYAFINMANHSMIVFDRTKIPTFYDPSLPCAEDFIFALSCYDHIPEVYHFPTVLHHYCKRTGSITNSANTTETFIAIKQELLRRIRAGEIPIKHSFALKTLEKCLEVTLEIEERIDQGLVQWDENTLFVDLVEQEYASLGLLPYPISGA
jgi:glycosyltransferase involved in cell wall biosynthesis